MPQENFDQWFDELSRLAQTDPEAFERRRQEIIEETLSQIPEERRERLRKFQWRLDMERKRAKTPLAACLHFNDLLMEMVYGEGGFLEALNVLKGILEGLEQGKEENIQARAKELLNREAEIIPFPKKK